jgi:transaldolase
VSIEVDPRLAHDTVKTTAEAKALWWMVDRPNVFIKIPATMGGLQAITDTLAEGISVNVTLIFSLERYGQVIDAFFEGLEKARANGHDLSKIDSVASFFVSRVDTEIDKRLEKLGVTGLSGKAGIANARLAYELFENKSATDRWTALKNAGARPQRPLWASTGVKNPDYRDTMYVEDLVAPQTVNTMPEPTLDAVADHGRIEGDTVRGAYDDARAHMAALKEAGVDYDDVVRVLEEEGVEKFEASWVELLDTIKTELQDKAG